MTEKISSTFCCLHIRTCAYVALGIDIALWTAAVVWAIIYQHMDPALGVFTAAGISAALCCTAGIGIMKNKAVLVIPHLARLALTILAMFAVILLGIYVAVSTAQSETQDGWAGIAAVIAGIMAIVAAVVFVVQVLFFVIAYRAHGFIKHTSSSGFEQDKYETQQTAPPSPDSEELPPLKK